MAWFDTKIPQPCDFGDLGAYSEGWERIFGRPDDDYQPAPVPQPEEQPDLFKKNFDLIDWDK